jgi:hypothetical protein
MKVSELIECLQKLDQEAWVYINDGYRVTSVSKESVQVVHGDVQLKVL